MTPFQFARRTSLFSLAGILILHSAVSVADDTEIFFGTRPDNDTRPNVLFILDDSGSMGWCVNSNRTCSTDNRMKALKDTMTNLLNTTSGVNVGLMVMNNSAGTSGDSSVQRLLQPVDNIDAPINVKVSSPEIKVSADDASRYNGSNNIADPTLVMGYIKPPSSNGTVVRSLGAPNTYSNDNTTYYVREGFTCSVKMDATSECPAGKVTEINSGSGSAGQDGLLLFRNLNIPKGVTITNATLDLTPVTATAATSFNLSLVDSKTPEAFNHSSPLTSTFTANTARTSTVSANVHSLNITSLLTAQQNLTPTPNPIGDLAIRLRSTNRSNFTYAVGDVANAPQLTITYTGTENTNRTTGLRFQTVSIPQGATITRATLNFVPASSDDRTVSFDVAAEASDNASDFSGGDFTSRGKTTTTTWTPAPWRTANPPVYTESGADVTAQVQAVVNRSGWCGNNAMAFFVTPNGGDGSRTAISKDGNDGFKPTLSISYTGGDTGCTKPIVDLSLVDDKDDARQFRTGFLLLNTTAVSVNESTLPFADTFTYVGARFQQVPFKRGAVIEEARLIVTPSSAANTTVTANVYFENVGNSAAFNTNNNNLGQRAASAVTACTFTSQGPGIPVSCEASGLKTALQNVLARNDWKDGNALSVLIKQTSSSSSLSLNAFESSKAAATRLQVKLARGTDLTDNTYKVRDYLKGIVSDMQANGGTPIVELMYQGASYYTALSGKHRGPTSPIKSSCQANYLVLMTDGQANSNNATTVSNARNLIGGSCVPRDSGEQTNGETCGVEIAKWLNSTDQASTLDGDNLVTTHTVGFALQASEGAKKYLADIASAGGGKAYTADDANALANAFNSIIQEALATDTTFVSATAPVNSFNRQDHKDQLYFSLFRPSTTDRWPGNLKRYRMGVQNGSPLVLDQDNTAAIDVNTGFFRNNARSWWSSGNDGSNVAAGGAASNLPAPNNRNLLTNIDGNTTLNRLDTNLTAAQIGAKDNTERDTLINYIRGYETGTSNLRMALGDPIHSTPSVVTYGCSARDNAGNCTSEIQSAILGTNEGFVQMFDTNTGIEQFAFMPRELLGNIKRLSANANTGDLSHVYGMDNSVTVWVEDTNENGAIDSGEFVYAYASMGRGGRNLYALDITNPTSPKIKWFIQGGGGDFTRLGQTWSAPIKTKIKVGGTITDVLIFGGGYDPNQDPLKNQTNVRRTDTQGNDLFIVDAKTGKKLWSASSAGIDMKYSVPSRAAVIGLQTDAAGNPALNPEGLATQIFVGDMGGQVWRFLINNGGSGNNLASGNVFASIAGDDVASARRFYNEPAIALLSANNKVYLTVNLGSGYRGHPLDKVIQDRFYSFRTEDLNKLGTTLTENNLYNATSLLTANPDQQQAILAKKGWYISLASNGEKVLSNTLAIRGNLYFNTYQPVLAQSACSATQGISRGYRVNLLDGTAVNNTRFTVLKGATLPSNPQVYCKGDTCWAYNDPSQLVPASGNSGGNSGGSGRPTPYDMASKSRLYWTDKSEEK